MKLPTLPFFQKKDPNQYFLSLLFQEEQIQAVIFEEVHKSLHVLSSSTQSLSHSLEDISFESLLTTLDKAISTAEKALPNNIQTHKTIFGLKQEWVADGQIKKDYLLTLKKACEELDLQPIGFLVFPEAIAHLLQQEEGAPVSAILLEIGTSTITATLLRAGRIVESHQSSFTDDNIPQSVDKLLAHFVDLEILPSRIIVADDQKRPRLAQQFIHHSWSKQLPFLHVPQITPLPETFDIQAILHGTATQLGFKAAALEPIPHILPPDMEETRLSSIAKVQPEEPAFAESSSEAREAKEEPEEETIINEELEEDKEVNEDKPPMQDEDESEVKDAEVNDEPTEDFDSEPDRDKTPNEKNDDFGFVQEKDVAESATHPTAFASHLKDNAYEESEDTIAEETFESIPEKVKDEEQGLNKKTGSFAVNGMLAAEGMRNVFGRLRKGINSRSASSQPARSALNRLPHLLSPLSALMKGSKLILLIPVVIILIVGLVMWYIFALHATVTLTLNPTPIDASSDITITTKGSTDLSSQILGGESVSVDESGSTTTDATGKKDTGDKAKGTVTLYNSSDTSKHFNAGATITSENSLKFVLDKEVTIASASGDIFSGTKPGTQDVSVTANTFGTDYNLPSGTKFSVSGTTAVAAKNANAFSGGTKKSLTVVSANDLSKAQDDLVTSLEDKAKTDMQSQHGSSSTILPFFTSTTLSKKTTDKKEGDEAKSVTLTATVTFESISYSGDELNKLAQSLLKDKIPGDMTISSDGIKAEIQDASPNKNGTSAKATLKASAKLLPKLDPSQIAKRLTGKSYGDISTTLSDIKQLGSADVVLSPNLFFLPHILPRFSSNIMIKIGQ